MNKTGKYFALTRAGILETMQWRIALSVMVIGNLLYLVLIYHVWKAIFASASSPVINGMTFETTMIYLVLATALNSFMEMYIVWEIGRSIQSGKIVLELLRPFNYKSYLFWSYSGTLLVHFVATFIPTFIVIVIVTKGTIALGMNLLYFVAAVILAMIINFNVNFFVGTICIYTESIWGINIMKQVIVALLSGATIPLAFFPEGFGKVVSYLPFKSIFDTPLTLLLDSSADVHFAMNKLGISILWAVFMSVLSSIFWKISLKRITVNGG